MSQQDENERERIANGAIGEVRTITHAAACNALLAEGWVLWRSIL
jgi:hypothetical protein